MDIADRNQRPWWQAAPHDECPDFIWLATFSRTSPYTDSSPETGRRPRCRFRRSTRHIHRALLVLRKESTALALGNGSQISIRKRPDALLRGCFANQVVIKRGPVVYCIESPDLPEETDILDVYLSENSGLEAQYRPDFLGGMTTIRGDILLRTDKRRACITP